MQSAYHNLPTITGFMQKDGEEYKALDVKYRAGDKNVSFSLDISQAYPEEALVQSWNRQISLNRGSEVKIRDKFALEKVKQDLIMNLMCWRKPEVVEEGQIQLINPEQIKQSSVVQILYNKNRFIPEIETIPIEDSRLKNSWGSQIYRIRLRYRDTPQRGEYLICIRKKTR